jgi:prepilin-type processing-associated H-X9-DG protein
MWASLMLKPSMSRRSIAAFTKLDMMIVISTLVMISILAVYVQRRTGFRGARTSRLGCVSNLKQIGLGFRMWSNDHGELFPWQVPIANGGTEELAHLPYAALHYLAVSNELNSAKILKCPDDAERTRTNSWDAPLHLSLSYFAGLNASETKPATILAGDRNVSTNSSTMVGLLTVLDLNQLQVTPGLHQTYANVALADGSVAQLKPADLRKRAAAEMKALTNQPMRLVIP